MSGNSDWLGKLKNRAKSVQESAKTQLVKLSDTVDKKLKEAQEDLEKQRAKAETSAPIGPHLQRWRPSLDNPDGVIVAEAKPIPVVQPQPLPPTLPPPPPSEPTPIENSVPVSPPEEPITIKHKGKRRPIKRQNVVSASAGSVDPEADSIQDQKTSSFKESDIHEEIRVNSTHKNHQINDQQIENHVSNELINKISTVDQSIENTTVIATPQKEESVPVQKSTSHSENNIDKEIDKSTSSSTKVNQENIQTNIPTDKLTPVTITDSSLVEHSDVENIPIKIPNNELSTSANIDDSSSSSSVPTNVPTPIPNDEPSALMNINITPNVHSLTENIQMEIPDDELPTSIDTKNSPNVNSDIETVPMNIMHDEIPLPTDIDQSPTEHSKSEDIPVKTSFNEVPSSTNMATSPTADSSLKNIPIITPVDEALSTENVADSPILNSSPEDVPINTSVDETTSTANIADSPIVTSDLEDIPIITPVNEVTSATNTVNSIMANSDLEDMSTNRSLDKVSPIAYSGPENSVTTTPVDEATFKTHIADSPTLTSDSEDIPIVTSADEITYTSDIIDSTTLNSVPEDIPIITSVNEVLSATNTVDSTVVNSDVEDIPVNDKQNELSISSSDDEDLPIADSHSENLSIKVSDDESATLMKVDEIPNTHLDSDNVPTDISGDENSTLSDIHKSSFEYLGPEDIPIQSPIDEEPATTNNDDAPTIDSDSDNISSNVLDDKPSTLTSTDNLSNVHSAAPEKNQTEISDDELSTSTNTEDSSLEHSDTKNTSINILEDELPTTTTTTTDASILNCNSENIPTNVPNDDDQQPTLVHNDESLIVDSDLDDLPVKISHGELFPSTNADKIRTIHADSKNIPTNAPQKESPTLKKIDDTFFEQSESEDEFLILTNVVKPQIKHSVSNENHSIIFENNIKTPPNELEDSLDDLKTSTIPVHRASEEPPQSLTHLAALRDFISKIEDDGDDDDNNADKDEKVISSKHDNKILKKNVNHTSEQLTKSSIFETTISSSQSTSTSDGIPQEMTDKIFTQTDLINDQPSIDEINQSVYTMPLDTNPFEEKLYPVVHCHSIPPGTKIHYMTCSSTYIYICTTDRKIFYAKLSLNYIEFPFKWQQYSELAEQLVVSHSNRTIWRLLNKHVYTAKDPLKSPPLGTQWNIININNGQTLLSMSINDQCGWYIRHDGTLWLIRTDGGKTEPLNVICPFDIHTVFCFSEKVGVITRVGEILIRVGCTNDCLEGDGWIFVEHNFGPIDGFALLTNNNIVTILDKKHQLWMQQWPSEKGFYEIICHDEFFIPHDRYLISVNSELLFYTDCEEQIQIFSNALTGFQWNTIETNTRFQRLISAFSNEDFVWALTTDRMISSSNGQILDKPRQAQYLTHATFVPNNTSQSTVLWTLDESCTIYVRNNVEKNTPWEQADRTQFEWSRRLVNIVCNHAGVWAVDDRGSIHFRHGHISADQHVQSNEQSLLPPAWITIPGEPQKYRCFAQVFCGPMDWMVYATDNKQDVYTREGINKENRIGTHWKVIEDCSALELAISSQTLWLLTSHGQIQCRDNISITNPIGTRSTTLPGHFLSLTVSTDDSQVWALDSKRNLLKLDRLTVSFEK